MQERVLEILVVLLGEFNRQQGDLLDIGVLSQGFLQQGYTENEINMAFSWLAERLWAHSVEASDEDVEECASGHRILHDIERSILSPEAYGYLIQLRELGLIDVLQMEAIIEQAILMGSEDIGEEDIKAIAASVVFEDERLTLDHGEYMMLGAEGEHTIN